MNYQQIRCHMVFDIKMEDFWRKARFVAGGHTTEVPETLTYASVVCVCVCVLTWPPVARDFAIVWPIEASLVSLAT